MKKNKTIFIQDWGTYPSDTLVLIGEDLQAGLRFSKKIGAKKSVIEWLEAAIKQDVVRSSDKGFCIIKDTTSLLWLPEYEDTWEYWETLIHEISHLLDGVLTEARCMEKETEARAYQTEYLFREIRRKIQALDKEKKK